MVGNFHFLSSKAPRLMTMSPKCDVKQNGKQPIEQGICMYRRLFCDSIYYKCGRKENFPNKKGRIRNSVVA